jgi:hypothetical protein
VKKTKEIEGKGAEVEHCDNLEKKRCQRREEIKNGIGRWKRICVRHCKTLPEPRGKMVQQ